MGKGNQQAQNANIKQVRQHTTEYYPVSAQDKAENLKLILTTYSVNSQKEICKNKENCFFGNAPTLAKLNREYDKEAATAWLIPQITELAVYSNSQKEMNDYLVEECANVIASEYYYLKVTELMLFFHNFKAGKYGVFYGSVSPLVITASLQAFLRDRGDVIFHHESELKKKKYEEERKKAISYTEYLELKRIKTAEKSI